MRLQVLWLLFAVAAAQYIGEPTDEVEEEDVDDDYSHFPEEADDSYRRKRDIHEPYDEHIRVKRCCEDRVKRSTDYIRRPRQVHQYEVHEFTDEHDPSSPPYEEMLAASADHYHRVYAAPGAPRTARYLDPDVSASNVLSVPSNHQPAHVLPLKPVLSQQNPQPSPFVAKLQAPSPFAHVSSYASPVLSVGHDVPLSVASAPVVPLQQLAGDQSVAAAGHHPHKHSHGHSQGGGHANHAKHYNEHGGKTTKGFKHDHYLDKGGKGHKTDEHHRKEYEEAQGKKKKHHDEAGHKGSHEEEAHGHRGAQFDEKKGHKKGHKTKGYHNKYHKDEFHKEHKFYDDYHKSGEHHRYGKFNAKHASNESGKKKAHHVNAGHDYVERGKKGYSNKGHVDADHKGHDGKHGHEEHHEHHSSHGKKGGKEGGSHWGHAKKH